MMWNIVSGQSLHHHRWGDDYVLYNDLSGATHMLDDDAMQLLLALRDGDVEQAELDDPALADALASLAQLHLIVPTP
ncbi:HPr-rel-A system PqqD family peptide chaperone [Rugamonas sp.]|uniref:HPr-rel-A system PqqD family peptide chaperone n=1 Tax=Rugamonas sp. TaxID=1926287 RepID=UPI0025EB0BD4|nr:HPr-rel-A system PqqD family peptide chaperone [Rugamonas sp.]